MSNECETCTEPGFWRKVWLFAKAMCSKRDKTLGAARLHICKSVNVARNEQQVMFTPCEYYRAKDGKEFCDLCGCPQSGPLAYFSNLPFKTTLTGATCPEKKW